MKSLNTKLIIYDSNCKVCSSWRDIIVKFTSIPDSQIKAYKDLSLEFSLHVDPDKFKNVMALIDTNGGPTLYGAEGVAYIFESQYRIVSFLLSFRSIFKIFSFFYKVQSYNRYIIATPRSKFQCDCFPDKVIKYRVSYIVMTVLISILLTAAFGISLLSFFPDISMIEAAMQMLLMAGTGWLVQILLATILLNEKAIDYVGHLGSIMVMGLLTLVPWMLLQAAGIQNFYIPAVSVLISSAYMLYLHINRIEYLELSQSWTFSWFLLLQSTAFLWIYFFHIN